MIVQPKDKKILVSINAQPKTKWRDEITKISTLGISELALFLDVFALEQRKEVYRLLETSGLKSIPYVQLSNSFEEGEIDYLTTTYGTKVFGLQLNDSALAFIGTLAKFLPLLAPENPVENKYAALFSDESLTQANVSGVCLDVTTLEYDRRYHKKKYHSTIHTLDHHPLLATQIGPVSQNIFNKTFRLKADHLSTLSDLHYLRNFPKTYLANMLVLDLKNSLEEQLEVKAYLELMLK